LHHIRNSDLLRHWPEPLSLDRKTVDYQQVIFEPVVESLRWLLDVNGLSPKKIQWKSDVELPSLRIDIDLMQHAVRNILLNSIYFRSHEPDRFLIEVVAFDNVTNLSIRFRDFGIGIEDGAAEALFLPGVRSPRACQHLVAAQGVGLWAARRVVESHGGRVEFTASKNPTEVTISIPTRHGQHSGGRVWS